MDDLNRAYEILGVNASMSIEEIEATYDALLLKYAKESEQNMYYRQKLMEWEEAYECIMEHRELEEESIYPSPSKYSTNLEVKIGSLMMGIILLIGGIIFVEQLFLKEEIELETSNNLTSMTSSLTPTDALFELGNNFTLSLSKINEYDQWDWGYYENEDNWTVVVVLEVSEAEELGALINLYNFRLEDDYPTSNIVEDIYLDSTINHIHYLGDYSELVPKSRKFGVVFNVDAFYNGEERFIYYTHPDGRVQTVGSLYFESDIDEFKEPGIYVDAY